MKNRKNTTTSDKTEFVGFALDLANVLLSAFLLGYVIGKNQKKPQK